MIFFKHFHSAAIGYPIVGDPTYSLYGEAAMFGGLDKLTAYLTNTDEDDQNHTALANATTTKSAESVTAETIYGADWTQKKMSRCSLDTMKAWTTVHPPNVKPMCLHAAYLKLKHPVTGEVCEWDAPATF